MPAPQPISAPAARTRPSWVVALLVAVGLALLWAVVAATGPAATYHLAPGVVAGAYPALRWPALAWRGERAITVVIGAGIALAAAVVLQLAGLLDGPVLAGGNGFGEAVLVVAATTTLGVGSALGSPPPRG